MATANNQTKGKTLRARVEISLKRRVNKYRKRQSEASFVRDAVVEYLDRHEAKAA